MTTPADRHRRAGTIFDEACTLPEPERARFLDDACAGDAALRVEVETLLAHDRDGSEIGRAVHPGAGVDLLAGDLAAEMGETTSVMPERVGPYRIVRLVGQGGMGIVFEATQEHPRRTLALKVLHDYRMGADAQRRFHREADLLARLQHPGIASVYDAGIAEVRTSSGVATPQPYLAMELIDGRTVDAYARARSLDVPARLALVADLCDAVQHAHERGVIHRDLKPGNVLVTRDGQPKVLDFGVSRATDADVNTLTMQTHVGQLIGTIPYMSPEQMSGDPALIDGRSDVYAIGVILFELLTGRLPHDLRDQPIPEAVRIVREEEPTRAGSVDRSLRGDVETIVSTALDKDPERRYGSPTALASDIRRYLAHDPLVARPASTFYRVRKFARRHRTLVGGVVATFVALVIGLVATLRFAVLESRARQTAQEHAVESDEAAARANIAAAQAWLSQGDIASAELYLSRIPRSHRGWVWSHLASRLDESEIVVPLGSEQMHEQGVHIDIAPDGSPVRMHHRSFGRSRIVTWWPAEDELAVDWIDAGRAAVLLRGTQRVVAFGDGDVVEFDVGRETERKIHTQMEDVGSRIAMQCALDEATWELILANVRQARVSGLDVRRVVTDHTGTRLGLLGVRDAWIWDVERGQLEMQLPDHPEGAWSADFSPDGMRVVTAGRDRVVRCFDLAAGGAERWAATGHDDAVLCVALDPSGRLVASGGQDQVVHVWDAETGASRGTLRGHRLPVTAIAWHRQSSSLYSADGEALRLWDRDATADVAVLRNHEYQVRTFAVGETSRVLASAGRSVVLHDFRTGTTLGEAAFELPVYQLAFSPEETHLAVVEWQSGAGRLHVIDLRSGARRRVDIARLSAPVMFDARGRLLVGERDGLKVYDGEGRLVDVRPFIRSFTPAPDLAQYVTGRSGEPLTMYDTTTGERLRTWPEQTGAVLAVALPGPLVALQGDASARLFDTKNDRVIGLLGGHSGKVLAAAFAPGGDLIATAGVDRSVRIWDRDSMEEVIGFREHLDDVNALVFTPDGSTLFSGSSDHTIRMWDVRSPSQLLADRTAHAERVARWRETIASRRASGEPLESIASSLDTDRSLDDEERIAARQAILATALAGR